MRPRRTSTLLLTALAGLGSLAAAGPLAAQAFTPLQITFEHGSDAEAATAGLLREILDRYDLGRWILTARVHIDERAIPHSHPVLTLHTRHRDEHGLLATFLHEQFHWLEEGNPAFRRAMEAFAAEYPDAPSGGPEGARDLESTYRHLLVCDLEYQAMTALVGEERAREVLSANRHYTWIYDRVLSDPAVRRIAGEHGFRLAEMGQLR